MRAWEIAGYLTKLGCWDGLAHPKVDLAVGGRRQRHQPLHEFKQISRPRGFVDEHLVTLVSSFPGLASVKEIAMRDRENELSPTTWVTLCFRVPRDHAARQDR